MSSCELGLRKILDIYSQQHTPSKKDICLYTKHDNRLGTTADLTGAVVAAAASAAVDPAVGRQHDVNPYYQKTREDPGVVDQIPNCGLPLMLLLLLLPQRPRRRKREREGVGKGVLCRVVLCGAY